MASHVPFLAVRPDEQFSTDINTTARTTTVMDDVDMVVAIDSPPPLTRAPPAQVASHTPRWLRLPLIIVMSLTLSTLLRTFTAELTGIKFAPASRDASERPELVLALVGYKVAELVIAWYAGYDCTWTTEERTIPVQNVY